MTEVDEAEKIVNALQEQHAVLLARSRLPPSEAHLAAVQCELKEAQAQLDLAKTKAIEREIFIEKLKGPSPFTPSETPEEVAAWKEHMAALRAKALQPTPRPGDRPPPTMEERKAKLEHAARAERLKQGSGV
jgi:hypothetical protein